MKKALALVWTCILLLTACSSTNTSYTILDGDQVVSFNSSERTPSRLLSRAGLELGQDDRVIFLGETIPLDTSLPDEKKIVLEIHRAVDLTIILPNGQETVHSSALNVGEVLRELGFSLYATDKISPPVETPISQPMTITFVPSDEISITVDHYQISSRSSDGTVDASLMDAGIPLVGLDYASVAESSSESGKRQLEVNRVVETVTLTQKIIPYQTVNEFTANLELDQQELLQGGDSGLAIARTRTRNENGVQTSINAEGETVVRPPQDRIIGYGTKIVIRTAVVEGVTIEYWRALSLFATNYSPCDSAGEPGKCYYYTASRKLVQRGTIAFVQSWYFLFKGQPLYVSGYGFASVEDVGGGCPPAAAAVGCPAGGHYWIDQGWSEEEVATRPTGISFRWKTVYFLTPVPADPGFILP